MTHQPGLTICVPSRNRQFYFQKTIEGLLKNERPDVQFVFADNSDDPAIMNEFMAALPKDPRVVYLPSTGTVLSMLDNWERTIRAATGEWVSFIGDDDFFDAELAAFLQRLMVVEPEVEALSWPPITYRWRESEGDENAVSVPIIDKCVKVRQDNLMKWMLGWEHAKTVPVSGFSIYHGAVRRRLLTKIYTTYGCYFENPNVDYDMAIKVIYQGRHFATVLRPFSIMGSCKESNSYSIGRLDDMKKKIQTFMDELDGDLETDPIYNKFPFRSSLGVTASIACTQHWFKEKYKPRQTGWEKDWEKAFAKSCAYNTEVFTDPEAFDLVKAGYEAAFKAWQGGRYLKYYKPEVKEREKSLIPTGFYDQGVYIRSDIAGCRTPADIWEIANAMITPAEIIPLRPEGLRYAQQEQGLRIEAGEEKPRQVAVNFKQQQSHKRFRGGRR